MKPKNFPARKLQRQLAAKARNGETIVDPDSQWAAARAIRTKKDRRGTR